MCVQVVSHTFVATWGISKYFICLSTEEQQEPIVAMLQSIYTKGKPFILRALKEMASASGCWSRKKLSSDQCVLSFVGHNARRASPDLFHNQDLFGPARDSSHATM
mmetsp:Transcript_35254/g.59180  ORF Transcript_35254/g.59180 Transcript_35254/m.59180 type:complete len:106 (+) Transcript_35254:1700-2017(+)